VALDSPQLFVGAKQKNVPEAKADKWGDIWTSVGIDTDTKLVVSFFVGPRSPLIVAHGLMKDMASPVIDRVQLTTDGLKMYMEAVDSAFGGDVDYAMLQKHYAGGAEANSRYSPPRLVTTIKEAIRGNPDPRHISTSFVERQNLTMRISMRRFTRLTNGFSKKAENHMHAVALHFLYYNFGRIHKTLRVTPAMQAGVSDHVWSIEEIVGLLDSPSAVAA
jgi:IS1 family transposase